MKRPLLIAIDGPAASGKSSTAAAVARALRLPHVDSGALYRAVTWCALQAGVTESNAILHAVDSNRLQLHPEHDGRFRVLCAGHSIDDEIRSPAVTQAVSAIAAIPAVRDWVNTRLRRSVTATGGVMDGRDIGSVVFPDADLKVFLTASPEARAKRRLLQGNQEINAEALAAETARLRERDFQDSERRTAPLRQAVDARLLDSSEMSFAQQLATVLEWARALDQTPG